MMHAMMHASWMMHASHQVHWRQLSRGAFATQGFCTSPWAQATQIDTWRAMSAKLDACGGHFGITPDSAGSSVYHNHVQDMPPFTFGCYGEHPRG